MNKIVFCSSCTKSSVFNLVCSPINTLNLFFFYRGISEVSSYLLKILFGPQMCRIIWFFPAAHVSNRDQEAAWKLRGR